MIRVAGCSDTTSGIWLRLCFLLVKRSFHILYDVYNMFSSNASSWFWTYNIHLVASLQNRVRMPGVVGF